MRLLVDTCVWSQALKTNQKEVHPWIGVLSRKINDADSICITGIIYQEVLQGIKDDKKLKLIKNYLADFIILQNVLSTHQMAAELFVKGRKNGYQFGTVDCLIAATAIEHDCTLMTFDKDFNYLSKFSTLKLYK